MVFKKHIIRKRSMLIGFICVIFCLSQSVFLSAQDNINLESHKPGRGPFWNHDYSKTLVMKLGLSFPDGKGGSNVLCDFETALELIKQADQLTLQVPKIIYLVGWQYNGHDDKYPAMFEVNEKLKRVEDESAKESLMWLMREARKFHTTISLHINMTDAYDDSPLWDIYVENDLISKKRFGDLMIIGKWNNRNAYQINYQNEWKSGWTQRRIDSLVNLLPELKKAGTIHIDAWIARESRGHDESLIIESEYQKKALYYWKKLGIDVSSEWVMDYMTNLVPFAWHFNARKQQHYLDIPANVYTGSGINPDVVGSDFGLGFLFGQSMYGEGLWPSAQKNEFEKANWNKKFTEKFYLNCLQYFFLNELDRISVSGTGAERIAKFSKGVSVSLKDSTVYKDEVLLRDKNTVMYPLTWKEEPNLAIYSLEGSSQKSFKLPDVWKYFHEVDLYEVSMDGLSYIHKIKVKDDAVILELLPGKPYVLRPTAISN